MNNENPDRPEGEYPLSSLINLLVAEHLERKPLSEQSVEEIYDFFQNCDQIACVFQSQDIYDICPHFLAVFELISCHCHGGFVFDRPTFKSEQIANCSDEALQQIERLAEARIQELRKRSGVSFAICWAVAGHMAPRCSHSDDMSLADATYDLVNRVAGGMAEYLGTET